MNPQSPSEPTINTTEAVSPPPPPNPVQPLPVPPASPATTPTVSPPVTSTLPTTTTTQKSSKKPIVALVLSILGVLTAIFGIGALLGIAGIILGIKSIKQRKGMATAAIILGVLSIPLAFIGIFLLKPEAPVALSYKKVDTACYSTMVPSDSTVTNQDDCGLVVTYRQNGIGQQLYVSSYLANRPVDKVESLDDAVNLYKNAGNLSHLLAPVDIKNESDISVNNIKAHRIDAIRAFRDRKVAEAVTFVVEPGKYPGINGFMLKGESTKSKLDETTYAKFLSEWQWK